LTEPTSLARALHLQACANRLANHRLHGAMAVLSPDELHAPRTSFFPSLMRTLNHVLIVDQFYVAALHGEADMRRHFASENPHAELAPLAAAQAHSDERLVAWCAGLAPADVDRPVAIDRDHGRFQHDRVFGVLLHLFQHQTHHRGQVHAMLSGTRVAPPQLDEFMMPSEAHLRVAEMAALGWREEDVYGAGD